MRDHKSTWTCYSEASIYDKASWKMGLAEAEGILIYLVPQGPCGFACKVI